jgi:hypothetical protein
MPDGAFVTLELRVALMEEKRAWAVVSEGRIVALSQTVGNCDFICVTGGYE